MQVEFTKDELFELLTLVEYDNERQRQDNDEANEELEQKLIDYVYGEV